ncbi:MAG: hypothetical protein ACI902_002064, partial [Psychroserpens sp.]
VLIIFKLKKKKATQLSRFFIFLYLLKSLLFN